MQDDYEGEIRQDEGEIMPEDEGEIRQQDQGEIMTADISSFCGNKANFFF